MNCPKQPHGDTKVVESRLVAEGTVIRRRRECLDKEKHRFTTYERIERPNLIVIKKSGERQLFDRNKIVAGVSRACEKTPVSAEDIDDMVSSIEDELYAMGDQEVAAETIGEIVMQRLAATNDVAYVRFASVYRNFTDIDSFKRELARMEKRLSRKPTRAKSD